MRKYLAVWLRRLSWNCHRLAQRLNPPDGRAILFWTEEGWRPDWADSFLVEKPRESYLWNSDALGRDPKDKANDARIFPDLS